MGPRIKEKGVSPGGSCRKQRLSVIIRLENRVFPRFLFQLLFQLVSRSFFLGLTLLAFFASLLGLLLFVSLASLLSFSAVVSWLLSQSFRCCFMASLSAFSACFWTPSSPAVATVPRVHTLTFFFCESPGGIFPSPQPFFYALAPTRRRFSPSCLRHKQLMPSEATQSINDTQPCMAFMMIFFVIALPSFFNVKAPIAFEYLRKVTDRTIVGSFDFDQGK